MAAPLRELIARVVLRMDEGSIQRMNANVDAAKAKLASLQATASTGAKVNVDVQTGAATAAVNDLKASLASVGLDPAKAAQVQDGLEGAQAAATRARDAVSSIGTADPSNDGIPRVERQLDAVGNEAQEAARDVARLDQSLERTSVTGDRTSNTLRTLVGGMGALGVALSGAALGMWIEGTLQAADAVGKLSSRLGTTTDEAQVWMAFASQSGASTEDLSAGFKGLANQLQAVASGDKAATAAFKELGIATDGWDKKLPPLGDTLALVGGKLAELDNEGKRVALTQKLLSEGGLKLAPGFKGGTAAVQEQITKLKELAVVYDSDFVAQAEAANDEMAMFKAQFSGLGSELILTFLPALRTAVTTLTPFIRGIRDAFKNSELLKGILASAGIVGLTSFGGISGVLARLAPLFRTIAIAAAPFLWAFAKFALIALLVDDLWVALNGGKSVIGEVLGKFEAGRATLEAMQESFKLLKGSVKLLWGALSGDEDAIREGEALIDEFSAYADGAFLDIKDVWDEFWGVTFPETVDSGLADVDDALTEHLGSFYEFIKQWAGEVAAVLGGVWDSAIEGLADMLKAAGKLLGGIPGFEFLDPDAPPQDYSEWQPISPNAQADKAEKMKARSQYLYAGMDSNPFALGAGNSSPLTINNNYSMETLITGNQPKEVLSAVYKTEQNYTSAIKDNRRTLRHAVGATR